MNMFKTGDMVEISIATLNGNPIRGKVIEVSKMRDYDSKMNVRYSPVYRIDYPLSWDVSCMWWFQDSLKKID